jgi:hypothetical protein
MGCNFVTSPGTELETPGEGHYQEIELQIRELLEVSS